MTAPGLIRRGQSSDGDALERLMIAFYAADRIAWSRPRVRSALDRLLGSDEIGVVLVAEHASALIGYAIVTWGFDLEFGGRDAGLTDMLVDAAHRQRRVGRVLLDAAIAVARDAGAGALHLLVDPANPPALALYRGGGFETNRRVSMTRVIRATNDRNNAPPSGIHVEEAIDDPFGGFLMKDALVLHTRDRAELLPLFRLADDSDAAIASYLARGEVLAARAEHTIVGHVQMIEDGEAWELKSLAVVEARRRCGLGRALVRAGIAHARARGARRIVVSTSTADLRLIHFYQRLGFRLTRVERDAFTPATGYPPALEVEGVAVRDRMWFDLDLPTQLQGRQEGHLGPDDFCAGG